MSNTPAAESKTTPPAWQALPAERSGVTRKVEVAGFDMYVIVNFYDDHQPAEVFVHIAKMGSTIQGMLDALAQTLSIALRSGVAWKAFSERMQGLTFEPKDDKYTSVVDALVKSIDAIIERRRELYEPFQQMKDLQNTPF